jgi:hypothetical protein
MALSIIRPVLAITVAVFACSTPLATVGGQSGRETRLSGAEILKHPIGMLALQYVDLIHTGKMEDAMKLATSSAQARWKSEPESERTESAKFLRRTLPSKAELARSIPTGGLLIIEGDARATLNIVRTQSSSSGSGTVSSSSSTVALGFALENGQWRLTQ